MESKFPKSPCSSLRSLPLVPQEPPTSDPQESNATMFRPVFQGTIIRNEPSHQPRPDAIPGYHKFSNGTYDAFVALGALEAIAAQAMLAAPNEMIGYLVGRPFRDAKGPYAVVTGVIFAEAARCGPVTVE